MNLRSRIRQISPQLMLYFLGIALMGIAGGCFGTPYNNYLNDIFHMGATQRGMLEFPRELPGFLVAVFTGALAFLPETRVAAICAMVTCAGTAGLAWVQSPANHGWALMVFFTILWSLGSHVIMPVQSSIGMSLAHETKYGRRLGQMTGVSAAASIIGAAFVWLISLGRPNAPYALMFIVSGAMALGGAVVYLLTRDVGRQLARPKIVFNRKYWLYYVLCVMFGGRKQLFITFGPWVLIKVFGCDVKVFAALGIVNAIVTVFTSPAIGGLIDRWGERTVLLLDNMFLVLVCIGYGTAHLLGKPLGLYIALTCFVLDQVLFGFGIARTTYLAKMADKPEDVTASLGLGVSLDHAISMTLPTLGGLIWMSYGHMWVFVGGGMLALVTALFAGMIRLPARAQPVEAV
jgi:MFS family permease